MPVVDATVVVFARGQPDYGRVEQSQRWVRAQPPELEAGEDDALVARAAPRRLLVRVRVRVRVRVLGLGLGFGFGFGFGFGLRFGFKFRVRVRVRASVIP